MSHIVKLIERRFPHAPQRASRVVTALLMASVLALAVGLALATR